MDVLIIIALIVAAVILFLVELFVIPGISRYFGFGLHHLCQLLRFCQSGDRGGIHNTYHFRSRLHRFACLVYAIENSG